jgi:exoribonuclease-2
MFLEGHIIEFLDTDQLKPGYVRKQERTRLQVIDPRGRNLSMGEERVAVAHRSAAEADFPTLAREIAARVEQLRAALDAELIWQSVSGTSREYTLSELAELYFGASSPESASAVFRALAEDTLYFKRNGLQFTPKTAQQVETEQTKRSRQKEREQTRAATFEGVRQLIQNSGSIGPDLSPLLDRLQNWLKTGATDEAATALEEVVGQHRARDSAYDILLRAGRIEPAQDRFLVTAGVEIGFPLSALEAANALPRAGSAGGRTDYRALPALTIDDDTTLEVDDALTLSEEGGCYTVGVSIADVSAFVTKGDPLDTTAFRRCSTIYLPNVAVRMLPEILSTDLCSLRSGADRLSFTIEVRFDSAFNQLDYRIRLGTVRVRSRLSYEAADALMAEGDPLLAPLYRIALQLQQQRADKGAITSRRPEVKVHVHDGGIHVTKLDPNAPSRILVSEMMILANRLCADFAAANAIPIFFRTQEPREARTAEEAPVHEALAFDRLRRTFRRSRLSLTPGPHAGLGLTAYTQASSPIRRYADLVTQRQFTAFLQGTPPPHSREELLAILSAAEAAEVEIRTLEERSNTYWLLQYLEREKKGVALKAVVLDKKGVAELEEVQLRGRLTDPRGFSPGDTLQVLIESSDPLRGELRLKPL